MVALETMRFGLLKGPHPLKTLYVCVCVCV